jgi:ribonuclease P protein component
MPAPTTSLVTLQRRSEFLRIRHGLRCATAAFVIEGKSRAGWSPPVAVPAPVVRFGLTVTKQLGGAVVRNRIRRRLKSALQQVDAGCTKPGFDYVVIARQLAETRRHSDLIADLAAAFQKLHRPGSMPRAPSKAPSRRK